MDNVEVNGQKIGGDSRIKVSINTLIKIIGGISIAFNFLAGWAFYDLRDQIKSATEISAEEKKEFKEEFIDDMQDEYDGKFEKMFDDISDIKGDVKVILDRGNRMNPVQPNPNVAIQPIQPPPSN